MRLKKLQLHGFKTFADKTDIEFADGVTAIVGPKRTRSRSETTMRKQHTPPQAEGMAAAGELLAWQTNEWD